ncbi:hypothetical protein LTS08_005277 [Lithohypha guttulata]|uniref:Uncharacterized protein n=1 Tax=Lithohypha guttulata TaxID=1690604 RepID=A0AAN7YFF6_9EURO|nr:hypothetical protein LTR51_004910 [Lithohypha guttulata]KAK5091517.1 hypothetical protein LTR05_001701 [Lithohypha guttulata]KAK5100526.1 hypothetical protein LTS08_005277 [Lithohypha guttulata]
MAVLSTQTSPSRLLALPAELTCMISAFIMTDLSYRHIPEYATHVQRRVSWHRCKKSFEKLKKAVSLIWVNKRFRDQAMPLLQNNLVVYVNMIVARTHSDPARMPKFPLLVRERATRLFDIEHAWLGARTFVTYFQPLLHELLALEHLIWIVKPDPRPLPNMEDLVDLLRGDRDQSIMRRLPKKDDYREANGALPRCAVTTRMIIGAKITGDYVAGEYETGYIDILYRMVNLSDHEDDPEWYPAKEVCLMVENVCFPVLYHIPSGDRRALVGIWPWFASRRVYAEAEEEFGNLLSRDQIGDNHAVSELDDEDGEDNAIVTDMEDDEENHEEESEYGEEDAELSTSVPKRVLSLAEQVGDDLDDGIFLERALQTAQRL